MAFVNGVWQTENGLEVLATPAFTPAEDKAWMSVPQAERLKAVGQKAPSKEDIDSDKAWQNRERMRQTEEAARAAAAAARDRAVNDPVFNNPNRDMQLPIGGRNPYYLGDVGIPAGQVHVSVPDEIRRTESGGVVRLPGKQPAQEPTAEEVAARRAMLAETIRREKEANARQAQVAKVNSEATRLRVKLMVAGVTKEGRDIAAKIQKGEPVTPEAYKTISDIANMPVGKAGKISQTKATDAATAMLVKIDTGVRQGAKAVVPQLTGKGFGNRDEWETAVRGAVNAENSPVPKSLRELTAEHLTNNPPTEIAASQEEIRKITVRETTQNAIKQAEQDRVRGEEFWQVQADKRDENNQPVYTPDDIETMRQQAEENPDSIAARELKAYQIKGKVPHDEAGKQGKSVARGRVEEGMPDPTNKDDRDILLANGVPDAAVDFWQAPEVTLPASQGNIRVRDGTDAEAIRLASKAILEGKPGSWEKHVDDAVANERVQKGIEVADDAGRAFFRAQVARGVQAAMVAQVQRVGPEMKRQTEAADAGLDEAIKSIIMPSAADTATWASKVGKTSAERVDRIKSGESVYDIARNDIMASLDARFANAEQRDRIHAALDRFATVQENPGSPITISPYEQQRYGALFSKMAQDAEGMQMGMDAEDAKEAVKEADQRMRIEQNASRGLMTAVYTDEDGKEKEATFSSSDPEQVSDYYAFTTGDDNAKKDILARQAAVREIKTKAGAFAVKQQDVLAQDQIMIRTYRKIPNSANQYGQTTIPGEPETEEQWDDYMLYLREETMGAPETYAALAKQAMENKGKWQEKVIAKIVKDGVSEADAQKAVQNLANANEEWMVVADAGEEKVKRGDRSKVRAAGAQAGTPGSRTSKEQVTPGQSLRLTPDAAFVPKEQMPIIASIPEAYKFTDEAAYQKAEADKTLPDKTFVSIGGKLQYHYYEG